VVGTCAGDFLKLGCVVSCNKNQKVKGNNRLPGDGYGERCNTSPGKVEERSAGAWEASDALGARAAAARLLGMEGGDEPPINIHDVETVSPLVALEIAGSPNLWSLEARTLGALLALLATSGQTEWPARFLKNLCELCGAREDGSPHEEAAMCLCTARGSQSALVCADAATWLLESESLPAKMRAAFVLGQLGERAYDAHVLERYAREGHAGALTSAVQHALGLVRKRLQSAKA